MKQILFLQKAAIFFNEAGNREKASAFAKRSIRIGEKVLGKGHLETLRSKFVLSKALVNRHQKFSTFKLNREIIERALECNFTTLEVVDWLDALCTVLIKDLKWKDLGIEIYRECLKALSSISVTKDEDKEVLRIVLNIKGSIGAATLYNNNIKESFLLFSEVYEKGVEAFGPDDPSNLSRQNNLACILEKMGRHAEALQLLLKLNNHQIKIFGREMEVVIQTELSIAIILIKMNRLEEATARVHEVCEKTSRVLGPDHPLTKRANNAKELLSLKWAFF